MGHDGTMLPSWFDLVGVPVVADAKHVVLDESIVRIHDMLKRITAYGVPSHRVVLGGFCQGAVVALLAGLSYQHQVAGICAVSGWMPDEWKKLVKHYETPVLICHGDKDAMVPLDLSWKA